MALVQDGGQHHRFQSFLNSSIPMLRLYQSGAMELLAACDGENEPKDLSGMVAAAADFRRQGNGENDGFANYALAVMADGREAEADLLVDVTAAMVGQRSEPSLEEISRHVSGMISDAMQGLQEKIGKVKGKAAEKVQGHLKMLQAIKADDVARGVIGLRRLSASVWAANVATVPEQEPSDPSDPSESGEGKPDGKPPGSEGGK